MVTDSGMLPFGVDDKQAVIYVDIMNKGESDGTFNVQPVECCLENPYDCDSLKIQNSVSKNVEAQSVKRFFFIVRSDVSFTFKNLIIERL